MLKHKISDYFKSQFGRISIDDPINEWYIYYIARWCPPGVPSLDNIEALMLGGTREKWNADDTLSPISSDQMIRNLSMKINEV